MQDGGGRCTEKFTTENCFQSATNIANHSGSTHVYLESPLPASPHAQIVLSFWWLNMLRGISHMSNTNERTILLTPCIKAFFFKSLASCSIVRLFCIFFCKVIVVHVYVGLSWAFIY